MKDKATKMLLQIHDEMVFECPAHPKTRGIVVSYAIYRNGRLYMLGLASLAQAEQYARSFAAQYEGDTWTVEDHTGEEQYKITQTTRPLT